MSASIQPTSLCFSSFRKPALIRGGQRVEPIRQSCKRLDRLLCLGHLGGQVDGVPRGQFGGFRRLPFGSHLSGGKLRLQGLGFGFQGLDVGFEGVQQRRTVRTDGAPWGRQSSGTRTRVRPSLPGMRAHFPLIARRLAASGVTPSRTAACS